MADLILADVSEFQNVDWQAYGAQHPAVIIRACYGDSHLDNHWNVNIAGARAHCRVIGIYQYLVASQPLQPQVDMIVRMVRAVGGLRRGEFLIVDVEEGNPSGMLAEGDQWVQEVHAALGGDEWEYSYLAFLRSANRSSTNWIAAYQSGEPTLGHELWQYSDQQAFAGIGACDGSMFHGTIDDLFNLVNPAPPVPTDFLEAVMAQLNQPEADAVAWAAAAAFVSNLYSSLLHTAQPDAGGFSFWVNNVTSGSWTCPNVLAQFVKVATAGPGVKAQLDELRDSGVQFEPSHDGPVEPAPSSAPEASPEPQPGPPVEQPAPVEPEPVGEQGPETVDVPPGTVAPVEPEEGQGDMPTPPAAA